MTPSFADGMRIDSALAYGVKELGAREAKLLLAHATGYSPSGVILYAHKPIAAEDFAAYIEFIRRRQTGEPLQHIIGEWDFMGLTVRTDARALIPRPETELLVEEALLVIKKIADAAESSTTIDVLYPASRRIPKARVPVIGVAPRIGAPRIGVADVCTGSGCIAIALARLADVDIVATDISPDALSLALENAQKNFAAERITFLEADLLDGIEGEFDVIISNPPYITTAEMATLSPTVRDYEPHLALHGGPDGLDFYRRLLPQCMNALRPGGTLLLEIGPSAVFGLLTDAGFENVTLRRDYAELPRIIIGEKPCKRDKCMPTKMTVI